MIAVKSKKNGTPPCENISKKKKQAKLVCMCITRRARVPQKRNESTSPAQRRQTEQKSKKSQMSLFTWNRESCVKSKKGFCSRRSPLLGIYVTVLFDYRVIGNVSLCYMWARGMGGISGVAAAWA